MNPNVFYAIVTAFCLGAYNGYRYGKHRWTNKKPCCICDTPTYRNGITCGRQICVDKFMGTQEEYKPHEDPLHNAYDPKRT